ncbi:uncharacterized protein LOC141629593 [Silene latifolia]|uniref:uncharacterized protein LOC141629593 n=1 Tax=Silene latifolia TaxID=37657 RepID=UPI003D785BF1
MSVISKIVPDISKIEQLDGQNYKRWSQKLLMFFEQLEIDYVLFNDPPKPIVPSDAETTPPPSKDVKSNEEDIAKFVKDNKTARCHILNNMVNPLFDLFANNKSAKVHVYENLCADIVSEGMKLDDLFVANVLLEKFPPSWSEYRNQLKHKKKDMSLMELISHMRTEEANRLKDNLLCLPSVNASGKGKGKKSDPGKYTKPVAKIQKPKGPLVCYVCGKPGHKAYQCNDKKTAEAEANAVTDDVIAAVVVEANLDTSVFDKGLFAEFEEIADGECVYMGNSSPQRSRAKKNVVSSTSLPVASIDMSSHASCSSTPIDHLC